MRTLIMVTTSIATRTPSNEPVALLEHNYALQSTALRGRRHRPAAEGATRETPGQRRNVNMITAIRTNTAAG